VKRILARMAIAVTACVIGARPALAQAEAALPPVETAAIVAAEATEASQEHGWPMRFVRDVGGDYVHFFSKENAGWIGIGGIAALGVHPADDNLSQWAVDNNPTMTGADTYGSQILHVPIAMGIWAVGAVAGSGRVADTGRDLLRAQISVFSWTYSIKVAAGRTPSAVFSGSRTISSARARFSSRRI